MIDTRRKLTQILAALAVAFVVGVVVVVVFSTNNLLASASPIVDLASGGHPNYRSLGGAGSRGRHLSPMAYLREPMPWEDGYFDPTYHSWPKGRQQSVSDKQLVKFVSSSGGGGAGLSESADSKRANETQSRR